MKIVRISSLPLFWLVTYLEYTLGGLYDNEIGLNEGRDIYTVDTFTRTRL